MNSPVKIKTSNTNRVHKMIIAFLLVSTLISLALIITPRFNHIKVFLADFALHHIFITLFIGFSLLVLFVKFLHEYYKTHSFSWAGIKTYEYYNPATVRSRWYHRLQRMKRKIAHRQLEKINETVLTDVLTNEDDKSKRYRDFLNAMSLGNNFKHKVKLHVKQNNRNSVLEATVWYANEKHVTLRGGKVIPVKTIVKVVNINPKKTYPMTRITVAKGDGIGPEIMDATLKIIKAAGAKIEIDEIEVGEKVYLSGNTAGIAKESWDIIRRNKIFLKAPITTPQGGGYKSLNVTTRKFLGLYANVRPCKSLHPFVSTKHPNMDIVIVRENEEDLYAGIEHQQTDEVVQCLKLISRPGCEKIIRYAFEYAKINGRKKVTCFTKDNIMKQTDGLFHKLFDEIAAEYPNIENEHWIIDIGAAKMADTPEAFDVIVMPNLYGDVLSDVAAQIAGSVGLAGSSNIGEECAMFEAIHGSAPRRPGKNSERNSIISIR